MSPSTPKAPHRASPHPPSLERLFVVSAASPQPNGPSRASEAPCPATRAVRTPHRRSPVLHWSHGVEGVDPPPVRGHPPRPRRSPGLSRMWSPSAERDPVGPASRTAARSHELRWVPAHDLPAAAVELRALRPRVGQLGLARRRRTLTDVVGQNRRVTDVAEAASELSLACVYIYRSKGSPTIRYVGVGTSPERATSHASGSHNLGLRSFIESGEYVLEVAGPHDSIATAHLRRVAGHGR